MIFKKPCDRAGFETGLSSFLQSSDYLSVEVRSSILDDAACTSASFGCFLTEINVAARAKAKSKDSNSVVLLASLCDHLISVTDLAISENEHSLF